MKTRRDEVAPYETRDGSQIRELMHPAHHAVRNQSLAEAVVRPGQATRLHRHRLSEEHYHVTAGEGVMTLGGKTLKVGAGDTVLIPPGTAHALRALGERPLHVLCCCSPPYSHEDTELLATEPT